MVLPSLMRKSLLIILLVVVGVFAWKATVRPAAAVEPPAIDETLAPTGGTKTAVFAGGCFWGVQGVFQHVKGVSNAVAGYSGGEQDTANYETVSTGRTGHAESVEITYDPSVITYGQLLQIYFSVVADPTELNKQGPDHGTQYRSAIFYQDPQQKNIAAQYIAQLGKTGAFSKPIVTSVEPFKAFYAAETYHQNFLDLNPHYPYIAINDMPKVDGLKTSFPSLYRDQPVLVPTN
jgi:peptide-methionine (S)-S-oxide reductase